jgi:hypothetical protein
MLIYSHTLCAILGITMAAMKQRFPSLLKLLLISGFFIVSNATAATATEGQPKVFYRYTTNEGHKVVSQTIPPQYVRNGYELLTIGGEILKVVPPSPPEADADRIAKERKAAKEQARIDLELRQTYSSTKDIDSAKTRNLQELVNTIDILRANLTSIKTQLKNQEEHAATIERNGKTVPDDVLKNIATLRAEEKDLMAQIKQREIEYETAATKYDQQKARFIEISGQSK